MRLCRYVGLAILALYCGSLHSQTACSVYWDTRTAGCPGSISQTTTVTVTVYNINDVVMDFRTLQKIDYRLTVTSTPVSAVPENPFGVGAFQAGETQCPTAQAITDALQKVSADFSSHPSPLITPAVKAARDIPVGDSVAAARANSTVREIERELAECPDSFKQFANDPIFQWLQRVEGTHQRDFKVVLNPKENYHFHLEARWSQQTIEHFDWKCGENDIFTLSLGPMITKMPSRQYNQQSVPVTANGSTTTQNQLVVSGTRNVNLLGTALVNVHLPLPQRTPDWFGVALSIGPAYTFGQTPNVSSLGLVAGPSIHFYRSFFLTPGVHVGEFADYPKGLSDGSVIPSGFGTVNPVKRNTVKFAIGITFKTTSFKKSSQGSGTAPGTPTKPPQDQKKQPPPMTDNSGGGSEDTPGHTGTGSGVSTPNPGNSTTPPPNSHP